MCSRFKKSKKLHLADQRSKEVDIFPLGILDIRIGIGRAFGHPHDEADHLPIKVAIFLVFEPSGENCQMLGLPVDLLEEFHQIGIGVGLVFFGFSCDNIDRKESIGLTVEQGLVFFDEIIDLLVVFAISDTGSDHDLLERFQIDIGIDRVDFDGATL